ncbi:tetratricopeptide repeat protein [Rossellomorea vietnamensis]|uniref:tetratricopeptide repeat protein n=1 Tax=Rossellomorea vietnamensis TaxID=218284 RepID=UPI003CFBA80D
MISALGYIAGTLVAPNLAGYLISKGLTNKEEKKLIQEIEEKITEFNRSFDDKEVDSNYFVEFLTMENIKTSIFDRVFTSFESVLVQYDELSKLRSMEAIEYVNTRKVANGHPKVKDPKVFEEYFKALFNSLIEIRTSLLGMGGKALASTIDDSIKNTENTLVAKINESMGDNILLDDKVINIEELIDKGLYSEAEEQISNIFESVNNINLEQRVKLLYQRVRVHINTDDYEKITVLKNKVQRLDANSKYCYEIDYWLACKRNDLDGVNKAIQALKDLGTEESKLQLKEVNFSVLRNDYSNALKILCNENGELKEIFNEDASAYYHLGSIFLNQGKFREATDMLGKAMELKYNIAYDYNHVTAKTFSFIHEIRDLHVIDDETKTRAGQLVKDHERVQYFIKDSEVNIRLQHWHNYLHLRGLISPEDVLLKIGDVDDDLINTTQIVAVMSEALYLLGHYNEAIPYLERIWNISPIFLMRLCNCYKETDRWEEIVKVLEKAEIRNFDEEGIIFFYTVEIDERDGNITNAISKIETQAERYHSRPWFIDRVIRFSIDNGQPALLKKFVDIICENKDTFLLKERINLSHSLLKTNFKSIVRELLEDDYNASEEGIALYLNSFGDANTTNPLFTELKQIVLDLYSNGVKSDYVLNRKFFLEFMTEKYIDAYYTIQEYGERIGKDDFYHLNIVQSVIFGSIDSDVSSSASYLLKTSDLQYHIMAAQYFSYTGSWEEAKRTLLQAFYKYSEEISEEEVSGFVRVYFMSVHHHNTEVNFENVLDNTVVTLKTSDGAEKRYCLHLNESLVEKNGEEKFGCYNYKISSDMSLVLKAVGRVGEDIEVFGETYKVVEVLDINTYYFRYFLNKLLTEYPNNKTVIGLSAESPEALLDKMKEVVMAGKEDTEAKLSFYHFGVETGTPLSYLSGKDSERYLDTIQFLMNDENEYFYSSYSGELVPGRKYVVTISSLVVINALGYLDRLYKIKDRIYITDSVKLFVRKGINDAIKHSQSVTSTAFIDDDSNFRMYERTDAAKQFRKLFWTQILVAIGSFNEMKAQRSENDFYDIMHEMVDISDFDAIYLTTNIEGVLVTDDLFISKVNNSIGIPNTALNIIALLYSEDLIDIDELIEVTKKLSSKKVINCINHKMLFDIYNHLLNQYGTDTFEEVYSKTIDIFKNMFKKEAMVHHTELFQRLRNLVIDENRMTTMLYKLIEQPFGLRPYEELVQDFLNNFKVELKIED